MQLESSQPSSSRNVPDQDLCPYIYSGCRCLVPKDLNGRSVKHYVVWPKDGHIVDTIIQQLESFGPQSETGLHPYLSVDGYGVLFWIVYLTQDEEIELRANPNVRIYLAESPYYTLIMIGFGSRSTSNA